MNTPLRLRRLSRLLWLAMLFLAAIPAGCHRDYYRRQADRDALDLIRERTNDARWSLDNYRFEPDPQSRMFDPFNRDRPPMPPDDPESHEYMHCVDKKRGYRRWHANGDTQHVENPGWEQCLPLDEEGVLVLDARGALRMALLHSREYQRQLEELHLSALDVSFERFRFDAQFFAGYGVSHTTAGSLRTGTGAADRLLSLETQGVEMHKLGAAGSELVVGLANSLVWQFSGPDKLTANSVLDFTLVQPLLRYGGRDRVLERLTLSERTLLANVRQLQRYRQAFYVDIMTGRDSSGQGPSRRGGVFGGAGLEGFTGLGSGFGRIATSGTSAGGGTGGTGAGQAGGFLGLLQTQQEMRNLEDNLDSLRSNYFRLLVTLQELLTTIPEDSETVVRQRLQVAQARQAMLNAESRLINSRTQLDSQLDNFKIKLGLPPSLCVKIEDPMLEQVNLLDPKIRPIQRQVTELQEEIGDQILRILPQNGGAGLTWSADVAARLQRVRRSLDKVESLRRQLVVGDHAQIRRVRADGLKLGAHLAQRFEQAIAHGAGAAESVTERTQWQRDLVLLRQVVGRVERGDEWLPEFQRYQELRDAVADTDRLKQSLQRGGEIDIDWLRTDTNPRTRALYERFRDRLRAAPRDPAAGAHDQLLADLETYVQPLRVELQQLVASGPWFVPLDAWRTPPDEMEVALRDNRAVEIRRLRRLFVQFLELLADVQTYFDALPSRMETYRQRLDALAQDGPTLSPQQNIDRFRRDVSPAIPQELVDLANRVLEISLVQARDRAETVALVRVDLHPAAALDIAQANRLDWMNNRAALVDSWRLIQFNANALESTLDLVFSGDLGTRDNHPLKFDGANGQLKMGVQFDSPLTRLAERNTYRQALIEYQQARRNYYAYADQVSRGLRDIVRTMQANQSNFEIRREAVRAADLQIELNEDIRRIQEANRMPSGATAARDTVSALSDLLTAQNDFLSVWVTYEVLRRVLDLDLGTIQLDPDGFWLDPGPLGPEQGYPGVGGASPCWPGPLVLPEAGYRARISDTPDTAAEPPARSEPPLDAPPPPPAPAVIRETSAAVEHKEPAGRSERQPSRPLRIPNAIRETRAAVEHQAPSRAPETQPSRPLRIPAVHSPAVG
jgi:hypothetical protein